MLKDYIYKKIIRLQGSQNVFKLNYLYHSFFGEKNTGKIGLDFSKKPTRIKIVQETISRKRYNSFLEIGSFHNELFDHIIKIRETGVAILMVEQNARQALSIADRGYVLVTGENKFSGTGKELLNDPEVRRSFLGG